MRSSFFQRQQNGDEYEHKDQQGGGSHKHDDGGRVFLRLGDLNGIQKLRILGVIILGGRQAAFRLSGGLLR